jgi:Zn finger protein HypA/HybF involved in hydrogenase expression
MGKIRDITHTRQRQIIEDVDIDIYKRQPEDTCYFCEADDLMRSGLYDLSSPELLVDVECPDCSKKWHEVYELKELWIRST